MQQALTELSDIPEKGLHKTELVEIVNADTCIPGSTDILESSFGKLKEIEGDQSRIGFTNLILIWTALLGATISEVTRQAMTQVPAKLVTAWVSNNLGRRSNRSGQNFKTPYGTNRQEIRKNLSLKNPTFSIG